MIQITSSNSAVVPVILSEGIHWRGQCCPQRAQPCSQGLAPHLGDSQSPLCRATETELIKSGMYFFFFSPK